MVNSYLNYSNKPQTHVHCQQSMLLVVGVAGCVGVFITSFIAIASVIISFHVITNYLACGS